MPFNTFSAAIKTVIQLGIVCNPVKTDRIHIWRHGRVLYFPGQLILGTEYVKNRNIR